MAENEELMLLERVFLRIGAAETDEQFESTISKFLTPVLLKLGSQVDGVRKKVMELLVHVNKRLKSRPKIQLPMEELFQQYLDPNISAFVTNFSILYIKMGYPRLEPSKQAELVPQLLQCLAGKPEAQQNSFLQLLMPALPHLVMPSKSADRVSRYGLVDQPRVRERLLEHMLDMLLLPYNYAVYQERSKATSQQAAQAANQPPASTPAPPSGPTSTLTTAPATGASGASAQAPAAAEQPAFNGPPPALSESALKRVLGENPPSPEELEKLKASIVKFLSAELYPKAETLIHLLVANGDTRYSVATGADRELKRITDADDWNNPTVIAKLYSVFQGTIAIKGKPLKMKSEVKRTPASVQLRLKVFPYLLRSRESTNQFPACVQIVFDCLYGANTNNKLKTMAVRFIHHLCAHCDEKTFRPMGAVLLSGMVKLIGEAKDDSKLRMQCYVAVGKISQRVPQLVTRDITLLQNFFDAISKEAGENRLAVQEALSMMSEAFKNLDTSNAKLVEALIMQNIDKENPQARQMAVEYAKTVFPPDHIPSRYVLLLAAGDVKDEISAEAVKALRAPLLKDEGPHAREPTLTTGPPLPGFIDMLRYVTDQGSLRVKTQHKFVVGNNILPFRPGAYAQILIYLRTCLSRDAGGEAAVIDNIIDMQRDAPAVSRYLCGLIEGSPGGGGSSPGGVDGTVLAPYITIIRQLLTAFPGDVPMYCLLELVAGVREKLAPLFAQNLDWIKNFMFSMKEDVRLYAAELYALVVANATEEKQQIKVISSLCDNIKKQALEGQHGSLLSLGFLIGYLLTNQKAALSAGDVTVEDMDTDQKSDLQKAILRGTVAIVDQLTSSQTLLILGACVSLGELGRCGALPLAPGAPDEAPEAPAKKTKGSPSGEKDREWTVVRVVDTLVKKVQAGNEHAKTREQASLALGALCVGDRDFKYVDRVLTGLLDAAAAKQFELHFTLGDGLVCAALGANSPEGRDKWRVSKDDYTPPSSEYKDNVENLLTLLLTKYSRSPNPHIRQAACIWLMTLSKQAGSHPVIQRSLTTIQAAFMSLLTESDELTQDIASKGLGIVYEICGGDQKKELVSMLVDTLVSGRRKHKEVTSDTEVFTDGALGKTPDGQSISTYKELCSIANDLNQPDLIYKFMHLANHNSVWNSKKGAAFGFTTIAAQAGEQLAPYLHKIIPKLYRYQFDPNLKIQQAMCSIWAALVPKTRDTVDKYLPEILADIQLNLVSNQWRTRESSCLAVNDVLRGRSLDEVVDALPALWENLLRVRDDIKESVRKAAEIALKALSRASIKICDPDYGKVGDKATALVLPCLLKNGLGSTVKEVQEISLTTLIQISKSAGSLLKPHIPMLTVALLESLSTLEPQFLSYVSLHAASNQQGLEKLDSARIAASKTSPMMDTVNLCVQYVDADVLVELVPRLTDLVKSSVGLGTKGGCSNLIISLTLQCPRELTPYAGKMLGALLNGMNDRNAAVKKSYASAIGHLVKTAKDASVEKLILRLKEWYMTKEDESIREAVGIALQAMNRHSPDILRRHGALALPLCFLAMHQKTDKEENKNRYNEDKLSVWEEVWLDATPGTEGGIRLYTSELVTLGQSALTSQSWAMKAQGAATLATVGDRLGAGLTAPHLGRLLRALLDGLTGRTWTGKESLMKAISTVCTSCKEGLQTPTPDQPTIAEVLPLLLKECRKESLPYKAHALTYTADVIEAHQLDCFNDLADIVFPMFDKSEEGEEKKDGDDDEEMDRDELITFTETCFYSLATAWPPSHLQDSQDTYQTQFGCILCDALKNCTWKVELSLMKSVLKFIQRLYCLQSIEQFTKNKEFLDSFLDRFVSLLCKSLGKVKYSSIRTIALDVTKYLIGNDVTGAIVLESLSEDNKKYLMEALDRMANRDVLPELKAKASDFLKSLEKR